MKPLKLNILSNLIGNGWSAIIGFIAIPFYIKYLGIESYGLIGVFSIIQMAMSILDLGIGGTVSRELAKSDSPIDTIQRKANLTFSLERIYIVISIFIGISLVFISQMFSNDWIHPEKLTQDAVRLAFLLMAINFGIFFPNTFFQSGLSGLQKQVVINTILILNSTLKAIVSIFVIIYIENTIAAFLVCQIIFNLIQVLSMRYYLWRTMFARGAVKQEWNFSLIAKNWRYTSGLFLISILTLILSQGDKIILSKIVTLKDFGYYSLAVSLVNLLNIIVLPITNAVFPKIVELKSREDEVELKKLFHRTSILISCILLPISMSIMFFAKDILYLWTHDEDISTKSYVILMFLTAGTTFSNLMNLPYQYSLAFNWVRYGVNISIVAVIFFMPIVFIVAYYYGVNGSSFAWMILNFMYLIFAMQYLFSRIMKTEKWTWYKKSVILPILIVFIINALFYKLRDQLPFHFGFVLLTVFLSWLFGFSSLLWIFKEDFELNKIFNNLKSRIR